jgi:hypothetical protein
MLSSAHSSRKPPTVITVAMFSVPLRALWFLLLMCTLVSELVPLSVAFEAQFSTLTLDVYEAAKLLTFFVFGFLTPIAWWRYKNLGIGALFALVTTAIVELGQSYIPGHRSSLLELGIKLFLLFIGFATALDIRKYQNLNVGLLCVRFSSPHW